MDSETTGRRIVHVRVTDLKLPRVQRQLSSQHNVGVEDLSYVRTLALCDEALKKSLEQASEHMPSSRNMDNANALRRDQLWLELYDRPPTL